MKEYERNRLLMENTVKPVDVAILNDTVRKTFKEFVKDVDIDFAVCGGISVSVYLRARHTQDIDIIIHGGFREIAEKLKSKYNRITSFSLEHKKTGVEIECLTGSVINVPQKLLDDAIKNAQVHNVSGIDVKVISPKYIIAMKLVRAVLDIPQKSAQDISDIEGIVEHYGEIDISDLNRPENQMKLYKSICERVRRYKNKIQEANNII